MTATFNEARNDMLTVFKDAWDAGATNPTLVDYPNVTPANGVKLPPDADLSWARVTIANTLGRQETLSGAQATQAFERMGVLTVQIFTPLGVGLSESDLLSKIVTDAYQKTSTPNQVWFRNVRMNEIGPDGEFYQTNVLVDFTYSEIA